MKFNLIPALLLSIATFIVHLSNAQSFEWASAIVGDDHVNMHAIVPDAAGNVFVTGDFEGTVDFDPGVAELMVSSSIDDSYGDIYVNKLDASGNLVWSRTFGSTGESLERGLSLVLDATGNVYVCGMFAGTIDFDPGPGTAIHYCGGVRDGFVLKLDADGNFVWVREIGGSGYDQANALALDSSGNLCITGTFANTATFDSGTGEVLVVTTGSQHPFVCKYDLDGNLLWVKNFGAESAFVSWALAIDASDHIYTTGHFSDTGDFDPGAETFNQTSYGGPDIYLLKMDTNGNFNWAKQMGGTDTISGGSPITDWGYSLAIDAENNVLLAGHFKGSASLDPNSSSVTHISEGSVDAFVCKIDEAGNLMWINQYGSASFDEGRAVATDIDDNVYFSGFFSNTVDFDSGASEFTMTSNGSKDVFITKLDSNGQIVWAKQIGGNSGVSNRCISTNVAGDMVYVGIEFFDTIDFDPGAGEFIVADTNGACALKLGPEGNSINEHASLLQTLPYPNPSNGPIVLELKTPCNFLTASVHNQLGQQVLQKSFSNSKRIELNIVGADGLYSVVLKTEKGLMYSYRIIKE
jgi:hypothetical protein